MAEMKEAESEKVRKMAELRALLERRMLEMQTELEGLRVLLDYVNAALVEKGFRRAAELTEAPTPVPVSKPMSEETWHPTAPSVGVEEVKPSVKVSEQVVQSVPIKTATGELLADLFVGEGSLRVVLARDKGFTVDVPPFMAFLVERVLAKMQEKDREAAAAGEILPERILSYAIVRDGDFLREISIRNVDADRARELKSSIRWTLEKMFEKMRASV